MSTPLVSVVIPTFNRPQFLPRAIDSALGAAPDGEIEVIVVPNGPDTSWKVVAARYAKEARVLWQPIDVGNANVARNHGMELARGKYLRFLDDDDRLLKLGACEQLRDLIEARAEVSSGSVNLTEASGRIFQQLTFVGHDDFFNAVLQFLHCQPTAHLYLRSTLENYRWDASLDRQQDIEWMFRIASTRDWKWIPSAAVVGEWLCHLGRRKSDSTSSARLTQATVDLLLRSMHVLEHRNALTADRKKAIAEAMWESAHRSFHFHPLRASRSIALAHRLSPGCKPPDAFFSNSAMRRINPLLIEWAGVPKRWINHFAWILAGRPHDP
jgi:glycosyltransferase involved in cell wall biosynthesis